MGQRMAANLLQAGHNVHVWNRTAERCNELVARGATSHSTPREAAEQADFVISMLRDDIASRTVWLERECGALGGLKPDAIAIECSTLSLGWCTELAETVHAYNADFLDAPVIGSRPQAEARQLIQLVGGRPETLKLAHAVLETNADTIHHIGQPGHGMAMKLAVNALFGIQVAAMGELLGFLGQYGIDKHQSAVLLNRLPVTSPAAGVAAASMAAGNYAPLFPAELAHKDFEYAVDSAKSRDVELPITSSVRDLFARVIASGYGGENIHAVERLFTNHV
jgi:3-hydroxyisobutyrate dehydrogenase-like beta-hydroxyacid dehydrogenase